jgi:hypothetical protein
MSVLTTDSVSALVYNKRGNLEKIKKDVEYSDIMTFRYIVHKGICTFYGYVKVFKINWRYGKDNLKDITDNIFHHYLR